MERPKRPLSAYNLFFRYKRNKVLDAHATTKEAISRETIERLLMATPGLEDQPHANPGAYPEQTNQLRRNTIRAALRENLSPKDERNRHDKKFHGAVGFLEMNNIVAAQWKAIDDYSREIFQELAVEGREVYSRRLAEYERRSSDAENPLYGVSLAQQKLGLAGTVLTANHDGCAAINRSASASSKSSDKSSKAPKRPLSAYNLFYRFKRNTVLEAQSNGIDSKEAIERLLAAPPGLEDYSAAGSNEALPMSMQMLELRRSRIRAALEDSLSATSERCLGDGKFHGAVSFLEMNNCVVSTWKSLDKFSKSMFEELAEEGRRAYRKRVAELQEEGGHRKRAKCSSAPPDMIQFDLADMQRVERARSFGSAQSIGSMDPMGAMRQQGFVQQFERTQSTDTTHFGALPASIQANALGALQHANSFASMAPTVPMQFEAFQHVQPMKAAQNLGLNNGQQPSFAAQLQMIQALQTTNQMSHHANGYHAQQPNHSMTFNAPQAMNPSSVDVPQSIQVQAHQAMSAQQPSGTQDKISSVAQQNISNFLSMYVPKQAGFANANTHLSGSFTSLDGNAQQGQSPAVVSPLISVSTIAPGGTIREPPFGTMGANNGIGVDNNVANNGGNNVVTSAPPFANNGGSMVPFTGPAAVQNQVTKPLPYSQSMNDGSEHRKSECESDGDAASVHDFMEMLDTLDKNLE